MRRATLLAASGAFVGALLIAGCDGHHRRDDGDGMTPVTQSTVGDLAVDQITTKTCEQGSPQAVNDLTIIDSDAAVDVTTLQAGCTGG